MVTETNQKNRRRASSVDEHVGKRIRLKRKLLGLTQTDLAKRVGLTFQQVQKYEWGANRVGAGRLHDLSIALEVPVQYFFDGNPDAASPLNKTAQSESRLLDRNTLALVRAYNGIESKDCRDSLLVLCEALARHRQS